MQLSTLKSLTQSLVGVDALCYSRWLAGTVPRGITHCLVMAQEHQPDQEQTELNGRKRTVILTVCPDVEKLSPSFTTVSVEYLLWPGMVLGLGEAKINDSPCLQTAASLLGTADLISTRDSSNLHREGEGGKGPIQVRDTQKRLLRKNYDFWKPVLGRSKRRVFKGERTLCRKAPSRYWAAGMSLAAMQDVGAEAMWGSEVTRGWM